MFYTQNKSINQSIDTLHGMLIQLIQPLMIQPQSGFRSMNYGIEKGMKNVI